MKHAQLHSIVHNYADSLASGNGFAVGHYPTDIFGEIATTGTEMVVDFLSGEVASGEPSDALRDAIRHYGNEFPKFCAKHGAGIEQFRLVSVRYFLDGPNTIDDWRFQVTIEDERGKQSRIDYAGLPGKRERASD